MKGPTSFAGGVRQLAAASQQAAGTKPAKPALMGLLSASGSGSQSQTLSNGAMTALQMAQYQTKH